MKKLLFIFACGNFLYSKLSYNESFSGISFDITFNDINNDKIIKNMSFGAVFLKKYFYNNNNRNKNLISHGVFTDFAFGVSIKNKDFDIFIILCVCYMFGLNWKKISLDFLIGLGSGIMLTYHISNNFQLSIAVTLLNLKLFLFHLENCDFNLYSPTLKIIFSWKTYTEHNY